MTRNPYTTPLHPAEYQPTERFIQLMADEQTAVCFEDGGLVAVVGKADDPESQVYSLLFAAAPALFQTLRALVDRIADEPSPDSSGPGFIETAVSLRELAAAKRALHLAAPNLYPETCPECKHVSPEVTK